MGVPGKVHMALRRLPAHLGLFKPFQQLLRVQVALGSQVARHVDALARADDWLRQASEELACERLELAAEALVRAHDALGEIGGRVDADSLLGHIFASFCIGK